MKNTITIYQYIPKYTTYSERWAAGKDTYKQMDEILDTIPKDASVCCSSFLLAHVADRAEVYELRYHGDVGDTDYVIFDARYKIEEKQLNAFLDQGYVVKEEHEGMVLILEKVN